jgi:hypothetical protein
MRIERNVVMGNAGVDQSPSLLDPLAAETGKQDQKPLSIGAPHTATSSVRSPAPLKLCMQSIS